MSTVSSQALLCDRLHCCWSLGLAVADGCSRPYQSLRWATVAGKQLKNYKLIAQHLCDQWQSENQGSAPPALPLALRHGRGYVASSRAAPSGGGVLSQEQVGPKKGHCYVVAAGTRHAFSYLPHNLLCIELTCANASVGFQGRKRARTYISRVNELGR